MMHIRTATAVPVLVSPFCTEQVTWHFLCSKFSSSCRWHLLYQQLAACAAPNSPARSCVVHLILVSQLLLIMMQVHRASAPQWHMTGKMATYPVPLLCSLLQAARLSRTWLVPTAPLLSCRLAIAYPTSKAMQHCSSCC